MSGRYAITNRSCSCCQHCLRAAAAWRHGDQSAATCQTAAGRVKRWSNIQTSTYSQFLIAALFVWQSSSKNASVKLKNAH